MNNFGVVTKYMSCLHQKQITSKLPYVLDRKDLNIIKLRRSDCEAILHTRFQRETIRLKNDD